MKTNIEPIIFGKQEATQVHFIWESIPVNSEVYRPTAEYLDAETNCISRETKEVNKELYKGSTDKEAFLLGQFNLVKVESNTEL
jgi:hypothetical protein